MMQDVNDPFVDEDEAKAKAKAAAAAAELAKESTLSPLEAERLQQVREYTDTLTTWVCLSTPQTNAVIL